ncbi:DUF1259 domain-containing protein [Bdellovibrio sp. HCB-162]|uniref:DUF1259 domain-containing protein n=1 Tax=Bdellovibrio sp. HCB-162 TaxID=3394234 RepID=UPI0039BD7B4E
MKIYIYSLAAILFLILQNKKIQAETPKLDINTIEKAVGMKGEFNDKEQVYKVSYPRKDLEVVASGVKVTPALGLTAWAAFTGAGEHTAVMGDIVLTEDQVHHVMSAALDAGLEVTALHNHFFTDNPKIMFMHISGMGSAENLGSSVGKVFSALKESTAMKFPTASIDPSKTSLNPKIIETAMGRTGVFKDGVYKITVGRKTKMNGHEMGNAMGVNTWVAFAGSDKMAVVDGDIAMTENELQPVLKALRRAKIRVVAIHNHMTQENPRILFLHFWGLGPTLELSNGIKLALDTQKY